MGYMRRGEGADLKQKQKTALEEIRQRQKEKADKAEAKKNGITPKIDVHRDEKSASPYDSDNSAGDATQHMTTSDIFRLRPAKRPIGDVEDGEIPAAKEAKIGAFSDRALRPRTTKTQVPTKSSHKGTKRPTASEKAAAKTAPNKGPARPPVDRKPAGYERIGSQAVGPPRAPGKGTARPLVGPQKISQPGPTSPSIDAKKPSDASTGRKSMQTGSVKGIGPAKLGRDLEVPSPGKSLKRKAEEEPAGTTDSKARKTDPSALNAPTEVPRKPADEKPSQQGSEGAKPSDKKTLEEENTLKDKPREEKGEKKQASDSNSDDRPLSKKRKAEDDAAGQIKKSKCGQQLKEGTRLGTGPKSTEAPQKPAVPIGLDNFGFACFANAVVQCLDGIPELVDFYRTKAKDTVKTEPNCILTEAERKQFHRTRDRRMLASKRLVRDAFNKVKDSVQVQAYLGELFERMHTAASSESSVSPFSFLQALGVLVKDGDGRPLDGEMQTDADEFYNSLLHHLETEEVNSRDSYGDPTVVQDLLGCATAYIFSCSLCGHKCMSVPDSALSVVVDIPQGAKAITLSQCLDAFVKSEVIEDYKCESCKKTGGVTRSSRLQHFAEYAVIKSTRATAQNGLKGKISTSLPIPTSDLNLAPWFTDPETGDERRYEVFGVVEHIGNSLESGHWLACRKVDGEWWRCSNANVSCLRSEEDMAKHQLGCLFFLKRVG